MELRSKTQRETVGVDAKGLGFMAGEADNRSACDPSPPVLMPVGIWATPVPTDECDDSSDDTEQYQERADLQHRPGYLTLHCSPTRKHIHKTAIKRWVPNNRRVSNKRQGFEANVPINAGSQVNTRVF